jgi:nucleotide-binding universal stress UspA family protein
MIRSILAAVDGSPAADQGLRLAAQWAAQLPASLEAIFVENEERYVTYQFAPTVEAGVVFPVPLAPGKLAEEKRKVAEERAGVQRTFDQVTRGMGPGARFTAATGAVNAILARAARAVDLVVIGNRGRFEPPTDRRAGPTTETLIHDASRPVLVVPENARSTGPLLLAFDDSKGVHRVLPTAVELAERLKRETVVLTLDDNPDLGQRTQETVKPYLSAHGIAARFSVERGRAAQAILKRAEQEGAGLIVMGAFGRNPIFELFFGSTTLSVLERSPCPVLLMA